MSHLDRAANIVTSWIADCQRRQSPGIVKLGTVTDVDLERLCDLIALELCDVVGESQPAAIVDSPETGLPIPVESAPG